MKFKSQEKCSERGNDTVISGVSLFTFNKWGATNKIKCVCCILLHTSWFTAVHIKMSLSALSGETLKKIQRKNLFLNHLGI